MGIDEAVFSPFVFLNFPSFLFFIFSFSVVMVYTWSWWLGAGGVWAC